MSRKTTNRAIDKRVFRRTANRTRALNVTHGRGSSRGGGRF